ARGILHEPVAAPLVYAGLVGEQDRKRYRSFLEKAVSVLQEVAAVASAATVTRDGDPSDQSDLGGFVADPDMSPIEGEMSRELLPVLEDDDDLWRSVSSVVVAVRRGAIRKRLVEQC